LPDAFDKPGGASLRQFCLPQQTKRGTQQQHVPAVQGGFPGHTVLKLGDNIVVTPQEEQDPG
jgi:hypothetical protein